MVGELFYSFFGGIFFQVFIFFFGDYFFFCVCDNGTQIKLGVIGGMYGL